MVTVLLVVFALFTGMSIYLAFSAAGKKDWKEFRKDFLYSSYLLASTLGIAAWRFYDFESGVLVLGFLIFFISWVCWIYFSVRQHPKKKTYSQGMLMGAAVLYFSIWLSTPNASYVVIIFTVLVFASTMPFIAIGRRFVKPLESDGDEITAAEPVNFAEILNKTDSQAAAAEAGKDDQPVTADESKEEEQTVNRERETNPAEHYHSSAQETDRAGENAASPREQDSAKKEGVSSGNKPEPSSSVLDYTGDSYFDRNENRLSFFDRLDNDEKKEEVERDEESGTGTHLAASPATGKDKRAPALDRKADEEEDNNSADAAGLQEAFNGLYKILYQFPDEKMKSRWKRYRAPEFSPVVSMPVEWNETWYYVLGDREPDSHLVRFSILDSEKEPVIEEAPAKEIYRRFTYLSIARSLMYSLEDASAVKPAGTVTTYDAEDPDSRGEWKWAEDPERMSRLVLELNRLAGKNDRFHSLTKALKGTISSVTEKKKLEETDYGAFLTVFQDCLSLYQERISFLLEHEKTLNRLQREPVPDPEVRTLFESAAKELTDYHRAMNQYTEYGRKLHNRLTVKDLPDVHFENHWLDHREMEAPRFSSKDKKQRSLFGWGGTLCWIVLMPALFWITLIQNTQPLLFFAGFILTAEAASLCFAAKKRQISGNRDRLYRSINRGEWKEDIYFEKDRVYRYSSGISCFFLGTGVAGVMLISYLFTGSLPEYALTLLTASIGLFLYLTFIRPWIHAWKLRITASSIYFGGRETKASEIKSFELKGKGKIEIVHTAGAHYLRLRDEESYTKAGDALKKLAADYRIHQRQQGTNSHGARTQTG
ncbi:hypothetical protein [Alteribacter natronophilus]|uniref:hypothetical protein n=1 Tax=Alteribacter natronophilus TaxID=2583810 RepID=UPI00110F4283|nr:hypothetical protein [Alteribacter natronophilus]TMW70686.1 hypothetical protein FGB90_16010 [Alteribacter natronophilus]